MSVGGAVMQVEHNHAEDDRERDQDHSEHDVVDNYRDAQGSFWNLVSQQ